MIQILTKGRIKIYSFLFLIITTTNVLGQAKPNILWVTIEDTSPQFIGCYGNKDAKTPNIDKLAEQGVRFTNAFATGTVCSPSRCTIVTGVRTYAMGTGHHRSAYPIPGFIHGFPYYLQKAGYYTANNVKTDYNIANAKEFTKRTWNESSNTAGWWNRKPGQPFFAVFNFMDSHQSRTMTDAYDKYLKEVLEQLPVNDRIGEESFVMPPFYRDSPEMRKQLARVYNAIKLTDNKIGSLLKKLEEDHLTDSTIIFLYGDHGEGIPRGKTNGINLGYRVPFIVWFPPMYKHLSPWGTSAVTDEMVDFEDLAPTLISLAGGKLPPYLKGRILMGNHRSVPVPYLELSSDRSDNGMDMVRSITNGRYVYSRNYLPFTPEAHYIRYMEIGAIKQQMRKDFANNKLNALQKSLFQARPAEVLYDIDNDIWETTNLVNDPGSKEIVQQMRKQLEEGILQSRDIMFLPEYEIALISKTTTPYKYRLSNKNYPIKEIYKAAALSGKRGGNIAAQQIKLLNSTNKIIRYWAVTGLRSQSAAVLKPYKARILNVIQDVYPPVAITAAAIAYNEFNDARAAEKLKKFSNSENTQAALMAINYLQYVNNKQPFINTIRAVHERSSSSYDVRAACMDFLGSLGLVPNTSDFEK